MEEQLYLFEAYIENIFFEEIVEEVPGKKQIVVSVKLGPIVTLEIRSDTLPQKGEGASKRLINFNSGKSYLTSLSVEQLIQTLEKEPLEITIGVRGDVMPIGSSNTPWDDCFKEMVLSSKDTKEFVSPVYLKDNFCILENGVIKGNIEMSFRLTCFGNSIQTHFDVLHDENGNSQFLFKIPNTATTFMCSKYGTGGSSADFIPLGAIFSIGETLIRNGGADKAHKSASWTTFLERSSTLRRSSMQSEFLFPEYLNMKTPLKESALTFDIVSLRGRPEDDRFLDFITGKKVTDGSIQSISVIDNEGNERIIFYADDPNKIAEIKQESDDKTRPSTKTCQCPRNLNVCKHVLAAIEQYEKSHRNLKINGKKVKYEKLLGHRKKSKDDDSDSLLRLRGGMEDETNPPYVKKKGKGCYNPDCPMAKKLRSVGISQLTEDTYEEPEEEENYFCGDFFCPESIRRNVSYHVVFPEEKAPFHFTCKDKYCPAANKLKRLGLGPLAIEKCQGTVYFPVNIPIQYGLSQTYGTFDTYGPYGVFSKTHTPFPPDDGREKKPREVLRLRGGGTSPEMSDVVSRKTTARSKSPITECQEIMEQFDKVLGEYRTALETARQNDHPNIDQYISRPSTAYSSNCGHPRCSFISEPILPPIHWNCPDPLPSGVCQNPDCPYLPKDLKRISKILAKRGRNKLNCNFKSAPECITQCSTNKESTNFAQCPFRNPHYTVNMMHYYDNVIQCWNNMISGGNPNLEQCCQNPSCPMNTTLVEDSNISQPCSNPDCPFKSADISEPCSNPDCPFKNKDSAEPCSNPDCPFKNKESDGPCSNPDCPFKRKDSGEPCSNPDCPFKKKDGNEPCSNPDCPFKKKDSNEPCSNPDCPFKNKDSNEPCSNPDCPFKKEDISQPCSNPECPFKESISEPCSDPECPFKEKSEESCADSKKSKEGDSLSACACDNPECEDKKDICSNPECPYNIVKPEKCENPECPYRKDPAVRKKGICGPSSRSICGDTTCPYQEGYEGEKEEEEGEGDAKPPKKQDSFLQEEGAIEVTTGDRPSHYDMAPCTLSTCRFMGGKLKCVECATSTGGKRRGPCPKTCPGDASCPLAIGAVRVKKPDKLKLTKAEIKMERNKFTYDIGDDYPGNKVGHTDCVVDSLIVPHTMGWLWNKQTPCLRLKPRRGWRPGALGKTILAMIDNHRRAKGMPPLDDGKKKRRRRLYGGFESDTETIQPKPTLQIKRKEGVYYITMNPLKDPKTLVPNENPFMECTPLQFRILKAKPTNDFKTCICNDDGIVTEPEVVSTDSELDIEFSPPAGIIRPENFIKKKNVIHIDTQYNIRDLERGKKDKFDDISFIAEEPNKDKKKKKKGGKGKKAKKGKKGK